MRTRKCQEFFSSLHYFNCCVLLSHQRDCQSNRFFTYYSFLNYLHQLQYSLSLEKTWNWNLLKTKLFEATPYVDKMNRFTYELTSRFSAGILQKMLFKGRIFSTWNHLRLTCRLFIFYLKAQRIRKFLGYSEIENTAMPWAKGELESQLSFEVFQDGKGNTSRWQFPVNFWNNWDYKILIQLHRK